MPDSQSTLYTCQLAQAEQGLDFNIAPFYDPLTGHFTQADSIIPEPGKAYIRQVVYCSIVE